MTPVYVIDSRITIIAEDSEPPIGSEQNKRIRYSRSYLTPLGPVAPEAISGEPIQKATIRVEGQLRILADRSFALVNVSAINTEVSATALTTSRDSASRTCREQC